MIRRYLLSKIQLRIENELNWINNEETFANHVRIDEDVVVPGILTEVRSAADIDDVD